MKKRLLKIRGKKRGGADKIRRREGKGGITIMLSVSQQKGLYTEKTNLERSY